MTFKYKSIDNTTIEFRELVLRPARFFSGNADQIVQESYILRPGPKRARKLSSEGNVTISFFKDGVCVSKTLTAYNEYFDFTLDSETRVTIDTGVDSGGLVSWRIGHYPFPSFTLRVHDLDPNSIDYTYTRAFNRSQHNVEYNETIIIAFDLYVGRQKVTPIDSFLSGDIRYKQYDLNW
jgi:hypothetical protein